MAFPRIQPKMGLELLAKVIRFQALLIIECPGNVGCKLHLSDVSGTLHIPLPAIAAQGLTSAAVKRSFYRFLKEILYEFLQLWFLSLETQEPSLT